MKHALNAHHHAILNLGCILMWNSLDHNKIHLHKTFFFYALIIIEVLTYELVLDLIKFALHILL